MTKNSIKSKEINRSLPGYSAVADLTQNKTAFLIANEQPRAESFPWLILRLAKTLNNPKEGAAWVKEKVRCMTSLWFQIHGALSLILQSISLNWMTIYYMIPVKLMILDKLHKRTESVQLLPSKSQSGLQNDVDKVTLSAKQIARYRIISKPCLSFNKCSPLWCQIIFQSDSSTR